MSSMPIARLSPDDFYPLDISREAVRAGVGTERVAAFLNPRTESRAQAAYVAAASSPETAKPPGGNTGGKLPAIAVCVDWLNVTLPVASRELIITYLGQFFGSGAELGYGFNTYKNAYQFSNGGLVLWSEGRREVLVSLNGNAMSYFDAPQLLGFLKDLRRLDAKVTRIDLAWNDFQRVVPLAKVHAAARSRNFTGFRRYEPRQPQKDGELEGDSACFGRTGKNGSGRYLIWYDKELESGGKIKGNRLEVRYYKDLANIVSAEFMECRDVAEMGVKIGKLIGGSIDFIDRGDGTEKHVSRMRRLGWWQKVRDLLGAADVQIARAVPPLERFVDYFRHNLAPTLSVVRTVVESSGVDFLPILLEMLDESESRVNWKTAAKRDLGIVLERAFGRELASIELGACDVFR